MAGCGRTTFETVEALRKHVSSPLHKHKMEGVFSSNGHAIELCGEVAPGQEGFDVTPILQSTGVAPIANMTHTELLPPTTTMSDYYSSDIGARFGVQTKVSVHSEGSSSISSAAVSASDLGKAYRTTCVNQDSSTDTRTRAQKAAEAFNGYLSSDSEDEEEGEITAPTASERIDQHIAKNAKPSTSHGHLTGAELYERCVDAERETNTLLTPEVVDPRIKEECRASPSLFLEQSPNAPSWSRLTSYSENTISTEQGVAPGEETSNRGADVSQKRKRAASSLPNTPATSGKRPRISDER